MSLDFEGAKDLIVWNKRFLSIGGIWPFDDGSIIKFNAFLFYCVIHLFLGIIHLVLAFADVGLMTFVETAAKLLFISQMLVVRHSKLLRHVMIDLESDVDKNNYKTDEEKRIYMQYIAIGMKFIPICTWITVATACSYYLKNLFNYLHIDMFHTELRNETTDFILPYSIHIFFTITDYRTYLIVYLCQFPVVYAYTAHILISCFTCSLILHVCSRLSVLEFRIKNVKAPQSIQYSVTKIEFREIVQAHLKIIWVSQAISHIFNLILLAEVGIVSLSMAVGIYEALASSDSANAASFLSFVLYASSLIAQLYIYCSAGDFLVHESTKVHDAYYQCEWYDMPTQSRTYMIICMVRARTPLRLIGGGFYIFSLQNFVDVLKTTMAYVSLLRQVID